MKQDTVPDKRQPAERPPSVRMTVTAAMLSAITAAARLHPHRHDSRCRRPLLAVPPPCTCRC